MRRNRKSTVGLLLLLAALLTASGCAGDGAAPIPSDGTGVIQIGVSFPLSGSVAADGQMIAAALQMAAQERNEAGGVTVAGAAYAVALEVRDDRADSARAAAIAQEFADDPEILAVISSYNSSCMLAQADTLDLAGLPSVSPAASSPDLTGISPYFHRVLNSDRFIGALEADVMKALGYTRVAALYEDDDYGFGLYEAFKRRAADIGLEIARTGTFLYGETTDFSGLLAEVADSEADAVFWGGLVTELSLYLSQAEEAGVSVPVYADSGCYSSAMLAAAGDLSEGLVTVGCFDLSGADPAAAAFIADFTAFYGSAPSFHAALAYDAAQTLFAAVEGAETLSREGVNDALKTVRHEGLTGVNAFDENGDVSKAYSVYTVKDGRWTPLALDY